MTQILGESRNNSIFEKTLNVIGPIKNKFSKPDCKVCPLFYPVQFSFMPEIHATLCVRHPVFVHLLPPLCG